MSKERGSGGCMKVFLGCFTAGFLLLIIVSVGLYLWIPKLVNDVDRKLLPWMEKKARVIIGEFFLEAFNETLNRSELTAEEKNEWSAYVAEKWETASLSQDKKLRRDVLITESVLVVKSYPGIYYSLLAIGDRDFNNTSLTEKQVELGQELISKVTSKMLDGVYSMEELRPVGEDLYTVLSSWRVHTTNAQGQREQDNNLRDLFRALHSLEKKTVYNGDGASRDMATDFRKELEAFRAKINEEEVSSAVLEMEEKQAR